MSSLMDDINAAAHEDRMRQDDAAGKDGGAGRVRFKRWKGDFSRNRLKKACTFIEKIGRANVIAITEAQDGDPPGEDETVTVWYWEAK